jgi:Zn ribbon nucleic-acid-binding protein
MDTSKLTRTISLRCPTCTCTDFSEPEDTQGAALITCVACGRSLTREELQAANAENLNEHLEEVKREAVAQVADDFEKMFKEAFRGSKHIKFE